MNFLIHNRRAGKMKKLDNGFLSIIMVLWFGDLGIGLGLEIVAAVVSGSIDRRPSPTVINHYQLGVHCSSQSNKVVQ